MELWSEMNLEDCVPSRRGRCTVDEGVELYYELYFSESRCVFACVTSA